MADQGVPYRVPLFLLGPPADPRLPFRFTPPSFEDLSSQLCSRNQFAEPAYRSRANELRISNDLHRKNWEWCYILQAMYKAAVILPDKRALGFGTGREPLPSLLASRGVHVVATDAPSDVEGGQGWQSTGQYSKETADLFFSEIVDYEKFIDRVKFRAVDMNAIPEDLVDFDVCWSSCCFEHLGSLEAGLSFVENSLQCLAPGGLAVHTTEFNLDSNEETYETPVLSIYRKKDIESLCSRLCSAGHEVWPINFHPGLEELDQFIDLPPYSLPHLKLKIAEFTTTSIGLVVRKSSG